MKWTARKPDFFLVGAPKCGTTSIYDYFDAHPHLYVPPVKEPNYFANDIDPSGFRSEYRSSLTNENVYFSSEKLEVVHQLFVQNEEYYHRLYKKNKSNALAGDCSPTYLHSSSAAKAIKEFNVNAKILVALRNPVDRLHSHYNMAVQMGLEAQPFLEALRADMQKKQKGVGVSEMYFEGGLYADSITRFLKLFGEEQVAFVFLEDWVKNSQEVQQKICQFLNVPIFADFKNEGSNVGKAVRNPALHQKIMQSPLKEKVMNFMPDKIKGGMKKLYYQKKKTGLSADDRMKVLNLYRDDILRTSELVKRDLSNWLK